VLLESTPPAERFFSARCDTTQPQGRIATNELLPSVTQCTIGQKNRDGVDEEDAAPEEAEPAMADAVVVAEVPPRATSDGSSAS
jgi:hypothetical protein